MTLECLERGGPGKADPQPMWSHVVPKRGYLRLGSPDLSNMTLGSAISSSKSQNKTERTHKKLLEYQNSIIKFLRELVGRNQYDQSVSAR